jgi:hypothetical protein
VRSTLRLIDPKTFVCVSNDKVDYIINILVVKSHFITYDTNMNQVLLYASVILASVSFFLCCYACVRVGKLLNSVKGLEWDTVATLTGDIGTIKKSIQTLNNRINGLNSPKLNDELLQYAMKQQTNVTDINKKILGG